MPVKKVREDTGRIYWYLLLIAFLILASIIPLAMRVGVDPYHEGALFPSAVGVAQGLNIFSEVNNQYGFVYALVQSPLLFIIGNYLIITRIVGTVIVLATAFFCYLLVKKYWETKVAIFVSLIYLAINPSWSYLSHQSLNGFGAWINQYGVLILIVAAYLFIRECDKESRRNWLFLLSGGLSLLTTFVRLEFFSVWFLQSIFLILQYRKNQFSKNSLRLWVIGSALVGTICLAYLTIIGSFNDFLKQLIFVWFSGPPNSAHLGLENLFTFGLSCFLFLLFFSGIYLLSRSHAQWVWIIIFSTITIVFLTRWLPSLSEIYLNGKFVGPYIQTAIDGFLLNYSSILIVCLIYITLVNFRFKHRPRIVPTDFLQITCIGLLTQLHNINAAYIFMFNPILLAWFMCWLSSYREEFPRLITTLRNTFISLVASSLLLGFSLEFKPAYSFRTPILVGMNDNSPKNRNLIDEKFNLLEEYVGVKQLYFDCPYGLFSVSVDGLYSADKWTWNEIPKKWVDQSLSEANPGQFLLHCGGGQDEKKRYFDWVTTGKINPVKSLSDFDLYQFK